MSEENKGKVIDLTAKYFEQLYKKRFGETDPQKISERIEEKQRALEAEFRKLIMSRSKEKMMEAIIEWDTYRADEFIKFKEKVLKEIKIYEDNTPDRNPNSPYPPDLNEKYKTLNEMTLRGYAITLAIQTLEKEGSNWKKIIQGPIGKAEMFE